MSIISYKINLSSRIILVVICLFFELPVYAQTLVVHPAYQHSSISLDKLRAIYSMRTRVWPDGTVIKVFILNPDSVTHRSFCLNKLRIFPYQIQRVWDVMVYSGTGQSPVIVNSESEMLKQISRTPGSIGYISETGVPDNVKIISVQ